MTIQKIVPKSKLSLLSCRSVIDFNDRYVQQTIQDLQDSLAQIQLDLDVQYPNMGAGVGLAANQIDYPESTYPKGFVPYNIYIVNVREERARQEKCEIVPPSVYINAAFIAPQNASYTLYPEACLSLKGINGLNVPRASHIIVNYQTEQGQTAHLNAEGFIARIHQHEIDHGQGKEYLNQLNFSEEELKAIAKWLAVVPSDTPANTAILPGRLIYNGNKDADLNALAIWVTHEIQQKNTLSLIRNPKTLFNMESSAASSPKFTRLQPSETENAEDAALGIASLRIK